MMRSQRSEALPQDSLDTEQVARWLEQHPDFFIGRENLFCGMQLRHECGDAESLMLLQLNLLRHQLQEQQSRYQQLLTNARDNEKRLKRIERLLVKLVEASTTEELVTLLREELQQEFGIPHLVIWSYTNLNSLPRASSTLEAQQLQLLGQQQARSLVLEPQISQQLGLTGQDCGSAIICRLSHTRTLGLMVLAHPSSQHFRQQDTLFVEYLGAVISRLLYRDRLGFRPE